MDDNGRTPDLQGTTFRRANLRGARFDDCDLSGVVMRGVDADGLDIDTPWLPHGDGLCVNGVDVTAYVESELDRRFPGREQRRATDPVGLRAAWASLEEAWSATLARAEALPAGSVDVRVDGEWSFAQTLRHLVAATDLWVGRAVIDAGWTFHPFGLLFEGAEEEGFDTSVFSTDDPSWPEVLEARASRVAVVRDLLATITEDELAAGRTGPWSGRPETTRSCLHVILEEEWEHHRFAVRDLDAVASGNWSDGPGSV